MCIFLSNSGSDSNDLDDARDELNDAKDNLLVAVLAYFKNDYSKALRYSNSSYDNSQNAFEDAGGETRESEVKARIKEVDIAIDKAQDKIDQADDDGKSVNSAEGLLDEARDKLSEADDAFDDEEYDNAEDLANDADDLIDDATRAIGDEDDDKSDALDVINDAKEAISEARDDINEAEDNEDDIIIISKDKIYLQNLIRPMELFLKEKLALSLHPEKTMIKKYADGVDFLGYILFPHHILVRKRSKNRMFRKYQEKIRQERNGEITKERLNANLQSYLGMISHANSNKLKEKLKNEYIFFKYR